MTLRFYATGSYLRSAGDFSGVSISTACRVVKRVSAAIAALRPEIIKMPENFEECKIVMEGFHAMYGFPRVIGCIDGTHIRIQSPGGEHAEVYRNRKGYFSLNVQVVCNHQLKAVDIVARWPGSAHDATIFDHSSLKRRFEQNEFRTALLLGDSGYPVRKYLLTPLITPRSPSEQKYNETQIRTRNSIERFFGVIKRRFPVLSLGMRVRLDTVQDIIVATTVLHNIARTENEEEPEIYNIEDDDNTNHFDQSQILRQDNAVRDALIAEYFS